MFFKKKFPFIKQKDSVQCGLACLATICKFYGKSVPTEYLEEICPPTSEGISLYALSETSKKIGFDSICVKIGKNDLFDLTLPAILHWNQNHFVILYKIDKNGTYYICDPGMGLVKYNTKEFEEHWSVNENKGVALNLDPTPEFWNMPLLNTTSNSPRLILKQYLSEYKQYLFQILLGLLLACILQSILPFLTQSIVDIGIKNGDIGFIWLVLLGQIVVVFGKTVTDFIRRWLILHISLRINITLVSDFFIKLMKLRMSFLESKLLGDFLQRVNDHSRVENFLTGQVLNATVSVLNFFIFAIILFIYDKIILFTFLICTSIYCVWVFLFLDKRKIVDYELFKTEAVNQSKIHQLFVSLQEIKLQNCENRMRWNWEDTQADLFEIKLKSLKLQQKQEAGAVFINEEFVNNGVVGHSCHQWRNNYRYYASHSVHSGNA